MLGRLLCQPWVRLRHRVRPFCYRTSRYRTSRLCLSSAVAIASADAAREHCSADEPWSEKYRPRLDATGAEDSSVRAGMAERERPRRLPLHRPRRRRPRRRLHRPHLRPRRHPAASTEEETVLACASDRVSAQLDGAMRLLKEYALCHPEMWRGTGHYQGEERAFMIDPTDNRWFHFPISKIGAQKIWKLVNSTKARRKTGDIPVALNNTDWVSQHATTLLHYHTLLPRPASQPRP